MPRKIGAWGGRLILLVAALCTSCCRTQYENVRVFPVNGQGCSAFVVVEQDWRYPLGYVDADRRLTLMTADLNVLGQIEAITPSPTGRRVLIESYGEGHQFISVYDVDALVEHHADSTMIPAAGTLDPYPGTFTNPKWVDDDTLQFESVSDFQVFDRASRRGGWPPESEVEELRIWEWSIREDRVWEESRE